MSLLALMAALHALSTIASQLVTDIPNYKGLAHIYVSRQARSSEIVIGTATRAQPGLPRHNTIARKAWLLGGSGGMPPPGKFWISGLLRSFLVQFRGEIAGVGRPAASRSATSYLDILASYPGYEANNMYAVTLVPRHPRLHSAPKARWRGYLELGSVTAAQVRKVR